MLPIAQRHEQGLSVCRGGERCAKRERDLLPGTVDGITRLHDDAAAAPVS
jgi:hypothetical protein